MAALPIVLNVSHFYGKQFAVDLELLGAIFLVTRALDAIHVATAEVLQTEAAAELLEFWTHDTRQATAALSRGLDVRGV